MVETYRLSEILPNYYLTHLLSHVGCSAISVGRSDRISPFLVKPCWKDSAESEHSSPDPIHTEDISSLMDKATVSRNQAALKELS